MGNINKGLGVCAQDAEHPLRNPCLTRKAQIFKCNGGFHCGFRRGLAPFHGANPLLGRPMWNPRHELTGPFLFFLRRGFQISVINTDMRDYHSNEWGSNASGFGHRIRIQPTSKNPSCWIHFWLWLKKRTCVLKKKKAVCETTLKVAFLTCKCMASTGCSINVW